MSAQRGYIGCMQSSLAALLLVQEASGWREHILYTVKYRLLYVRV